MTNDDSNRGLTAAEAYVLAARLALFVREGRRGVARGWGVGEGDGYRLFPAALAYLLAIPAPPGDVPVHERAHAALAAGIGAEDLASLVAWIRSKESESEEPHSREVNWACKQVLDELQEIRAASVG